MSRVHFGAVAAALILSSAASEAIATPAVAPVASTKAAEAAKGTPAKAEAQRCVTIRPTGSLARKRKVCRSAADWALARDLTQEAARKAQRAPPAVYHNPED